MVAPWALAENMPIARCRQKPYGMFVSLLSGCAIRKMDVVLSQQAEKFELQTRILLLVEDNVGDAEIVRDMLDSAGGYSKYEVVHVSRLSEAKELLKSTRVDVVLLDLRLPDASGVDAVRSILDSSSDVPIVVLTGLEDEAIALQCIDSGAQDYLSKDDLRPAVLRRTIGYALARLREAQVRELQALLAGYRSLSSAGSKTSVTAAALGVGSFRERDPGLFEQIVSAYRLLLDQYIDQLSYKKERPKELMDRLTTGLGEAGAGPRDLLDVHVAALDYAVQGAGMEQARATLIEGRLLALEMMGLLVDYYRTGHRRRFVAGDFR